jgi:hypothetical protein
VLPGLNEKEDMQVVEPTEEIEGRANEVACSCNCGCGPAVQEEVPETEAAEPQAEACSCGCDSCAAA